MDAIFQFGRYYTGFVRVWFPRQGTPFAIFSLATARQPLLVQKYDQPWIDVRRVRAEICTPMWIATVPTTR